MRIRLQIREQLCLLIAFVSLIGLLILATTTWAESRHFIQETRATTLTVTANLKAAQISQTITSSRDIVQSVSTRSLIQNLLRRYNNGDHSDNLLVDLQVRDSPCSFE